jgi:hypothetical protein
MAELVEHDEHAEGEGERQDLDQHRERGFRGQDSGARIQGPGFTGRGVVQQSSHTVIESDDRKTKATASRHRSLAPESWSLVPN